MAHDIKQSSHRPLDRPFLARDGREQSARLGDNAFLELWIAHERGAEHRLTASSYRQV
jgi:hypothetical protein